jgi:hypothetical protein
MNDRGEVEKLARYFGLLEPKERLSLFRSWFMGLAEKRGNRGLKLLGRFNLCLTSF